MTELKNEIRNAYSLLSVLPVKGDAVDVAAACRMALRRAMELAGKEEGPEQKPEQGAKEE